MTKRVTVVAASSFSNCNAVHHYNICTRSESIRTSIDFLIPHVSGNDFSLVAIHNCKIICNRGGASAIRNVQTANLGRGFTKRYLR